MNERYQKALTLRLEGFSYNEIRKKLGIAKSTLSNWFANLEISDAARKRLNERIRVLGFNKLLQHNKDQTVSAIKRAEKCQIGGMETIGKLNHRDLLMIGATLYWAEGYKRLKKRKGKQITGHCISFVNSDPFTVKIFVTFLIEILNIEPQKIKIAMRLYEGMNEAETLRYWSSLVQIPANQFHKTTYLVSISSQRKRPFERLPYGTVQVIVSDTARFHRILGMIEGIKAGLQ